MRATSAPGPFIGMPLTRDPHGSAARSTDSYLGMGQSDWSQTSGNGFGSMDAWTLGPPVDQPVTLQQVSSSSPWEPHKVPVNQKRFYPEVESDGFFDRAPQRSQAFAATPIKPGCIVSFPGLQAAQRLSSDCGVVEVPGPNKSWQIRTLKGDLVVANENDLTVLRPPPGLPEGDGEEEYVFQSSSSGATGSLADDVRHFHEDLVATRMPELGLATDMAMPGMAGWMAGMLKQEVVCRSPTHLPVPAAPCATARGGHDEQRRVSTSSTASGYSDALMSRRRSSLSSISGVQEQLAQMQESTAGPLTPAMMRNIQSDARHLPTSHLPLPAAQFDGRRASTSSTGSGTSDAMMSRRRSSLSSVGAALELAQLQESMEEFSVDPSRPLTTVMMRNIPCEYSGSTLLQLLNAYGFKYSYDLVYLPMDYQNKVGFGYAFINFVSPEAAEEFRAAFQGFESWGVESDKVCEVCWGNALQGVDAHVERYRNSPVMHEAVPDAFKPMLFVNGERVPFPPPTKAVRPPRLRKKEKEREKGH